MMKVLALSQEEAECLKPDVLYIVISITNPGSDNAKLPELPNCRGLLRVQFGDTVGTGVYESLKPVQARDIASFVAGKKNDVELIVCHCEAGVSRSAGVASAISCWINGDEEAKSFSHDGIHRPNQAVYTLVLNALREQCVY
ncbi:hypothetical protein EG834_00250 [bacterium]|nr:hypothetical protein [bacterium]